MGFLTGLFEMFWPIVYLQIKLYTICVHFVNDKISIATHEIYVKGSYWFLSDVYLGLLFFIQNRIQQMLDMDPILELWFMSSHCKIRIINMSHKLNLQHSFSKCKTANYNFP